MGALANQQNSNQRNNNNDHTKNQKRKLSRLRRKLRCPEDRGEASTRTELSLPLSLEVEAQNRGVECLL